MFICFYLFLFVVTLGSINVRSLDALQQDQVEQYAQKIVGKFPKYFDVDEAKKLIQSIDSNLKSDKAARYKKSTFQAELDTLINSPKNPKFKFFKVFFKYLRGDSTCSSMDQDGILGCLERQLAYELFQKRELEDIKKLFNQSVTSDTAQIKRYTEKSKDENGVNLSRSRTHLERIEKLIETLNRKNACGDLFRQTLQNIKKELKNIQSFVEAISNRNKNNFVRERKVEQHNYVYQNTNNNRFLKITNYKEFPRATSEPREQKFQKFSTRQTTSMHSFINNNNWGPNRVNVLPENPLVTKIVTRISKVFPKLGNEKSNTILVHDIYEKIDGSNSKQAFLLACNKCLKIGNKELFIINLLLRAVDNNPRYKDINKEKLFVFVKEIIEKSENINFQPIINFLKNKLEYYQDFIRDDVQLNEYAPAKAVMELLHLTLEKSKTIEFEADTEDDLEICED